MVMREQGAGVLDYGLQGNESTGSRWEWSGLQGMNASAACMVSGLDLFTSAQPAEQQVI